MECKYCDGVTLVPGTVMVSTYGNLDGTPVKRGDCVSPKGSGKLVPCLKCLECGYSVTEGKVYHEIS